MSLLDRAKTVAGQATSKAKEGVAEVQTRRELGQAYDELGKLAFELAESGDITDPRVTAATERIKKLRSELDAQPT
jgi:hypothetical protein